MTGMTLARRISAGVAPLLIGAGALAIGGPPEGADATPSAAEARQRAKLLHGTIHDTLQVVHAQYFREGERLKIPAASLDLVFQGLEEREGIRARWLVVDGKAMNIDHRPRDDFEREAARRLAAGEERHEATEAGTYRFAGPITLGADCLKCHLPGRSSNRSRTAGLVIAIPVQGP